MNYKDTEIYDRISKISTSSVAASATKKILSQLTGIGIGEFNVSVKSGKTTYTFTGEVYIIDIDEEDKKYDPSFTWLRANINMKTKKQETYYETKSHTKKQQIAQTVVAKNTYATQIQKYGTFYLTPKSNVKSNTIKQRNTGFWGSIKPSYHQSSPKTQDQGNYTWTFSTNVSSGKKAYNLYVSITEKYKFIEDIGHLIPATDIPNPPEDPSTPLPPIGPNNPNYPNNPDDNNPGGGDNNNPDGGENNGGNNPDNPSNPDGNNNGGGNNPNNPGGNNGGNNNYDPTDPENPDKIGDKDNPPMIHIEVDIDDGIRVRRLPTMVHLYDIYQR